MHCNKDITGVQVDDTDRMAEIFGIAPAMVREIVHENDQKTVLKDIQGPPDSRGLIDGCRSRVSWADMTPEDRYDYVRAWVLEHIKSEAA